MRHCGSGTLRAYRDGQLTGGPSAEVRRHVGSCGRCRAELVALDEGAVWVDGRLRGYGRALEAAAAGVDAAAAWTRMDAVWGGGGAAARRAAAPAQTRRGFRPWPLAVGVAAALAVSSLALAPVRAAAGGVLQIFRVRHVQVVTVSAADAAGIAGALRAAGRVDIRGLAHVRVTQQGHPLALGLAAARSRVGFPLTAPTALPAGYRLGGVLLQPATRVDFSHLRVAAIDRLLASLGSPQALPPVLGSASIALTEPASVVLRYTAAGAPPLEVAEGQTPTLTVPAGVDVAGVRRVLLGLPFLPPGLRRQLRSVADWRHTAIVPQLPGVSQPVSVGGAQGTFVAGPHGGPSMLLWLSGGVVRVVRGDLSLAQAEAIAAGMA